MIEDSEDVKAAAARRSLALLNAQADAVRAELAGLRRDLAKAKDELSGLRTAQLLEANAELVQAAVHADSVAQVRWGLVPRWARDASIGARMINARAETVAVKPAYRTSIRKHRCLIPADGFYEWTARPGMGKRPLLIGMKDRAPFGFAGCVRVF